MKQKKLPVQKTIATTDKYFYLYGC